LWPISCATVSIRFSESSDEPNDSSVVTPVPPTPFTPPEQMAGL
jgi:hypothetical protein